MNEAFDSLNAQSVPENITMADIKDYIIINDIDENGALDKKELLFGVELLLFDLALEYALRSKDPYSVYSKIDKPN